MLEQGQCVACEANYVVLFVWLGKLCLFIEIALGFIIL